MSGAALLAAPLVRVEWLHALAGVVVATVALQVARDRSHPRRLGSALFWSLLALTFFAGLAPPGWSLANGRPLLPVLVGLAVVAMVALAAAGQVRPPFSPRDESTAGTAPAPSPPKRRGEVSKADRAQEAARLGNRLLVPPLVLAIVAAAGAFALPRIAIGGRPLVAESHANSIAIGLGVVVALLLALRLTRPTFRSGMKTPVSSARSAAAEPAVPHQERYGGQSGVGGEGGGSGAARSGGGLRAAFGEGGRLLQLLGWALILPQLLATLGGVFARCGVGEVIAGGAREWLPIGQPLLAVVAYCVAMPLFTILMGNAFAAFPLITLGIGLPFIVEQHGGHPAIMGAFGMLAGYCGTLVTPMAANFNVVPAILLELPDRHAVIKAQAPFALACWLFNLAAMAALVYRF